MCFLHLDSSLRRALFMLCLLVPESLQISLGRHRSLCLYIADNGQERDIRLDFLYRRKSSQTIHDYIV